MSRPAAAPPAGTPPPMLVVDTSVAVPLLIAGHEAHPPVRAWAAGKVLRLTGLSLVETYSVITRLPGDSRVDRADAITLMDDNFAPAVVLGAEAARQAHRLLSLDGITGGAAYDGLIALTAREHDAVLATRDARARATYEAVGARVEIVATG